MPAGPAKKTTVGAYEAKTHLPRLLDRVEKGERIVITRLGVPVAVLIPYARSMRKDVDSVVSELMQFHKGKRLGKYTLRELIEEGRR
ncbi:MAG: type II toxin-antitoxin system prevent-host-death family antitoxin [Planctomycetota bacterium]|nr:MAG: type II toxin-antitoxin system prevent-host-death family antitoxin [Planctomycetota bacterium]